MLLIALGSGLWRHLSNDYGPSLAVSSTLLFLLALNTSHDPAVAEHSVLATLAGGAWGLLLQVINWPFRPQHPLRRTVADSWLAVADLFEAITPGDDVDRAQRHQQVNEREALLRTTLDHTYATLAVAFAARRSPLVERLEHLNLAAARLATRVVAFNTALENLMTQPAFAALAPSIAPVLMSLTNTARTIAVAVVSRQPAHLATAEVRLRRLANLLQVLRARVTAQTGGNHTGSQLAEILRQIEIHLPAIRAALRATIDRAEERAAFPLELFDVNTWTLRPLASALNLNLRLDPALVRFTCRIALLTVLGVLIFKSTHLAHGYWLPFTMVVVLQPDYGSTRQRAAQRVLGTLAGSLVATLLLWLDPTFAVIAAATAVTILGFGFFLKRNYAIAVFFVTLMVVLLTEAREPVTIGFTVERLSSTLAGGTLALLAALFFWPVWERDRLPPILATALRVNRDYWQLLAARLATGGAYDQEAIDAKRHAEAANSAVFSSLQRMIADPKNRQEGIELAATLANGNQRIAHSLTVVTLHLTPGIPMPQSELAELTRLATTALDTLATAVETGRPDPQLRRLLETLENFRLPLPPTDGFSPDGQRDHWVFAQFTRSATELSAMLLAASNESGTGSLASAE